MKLGKHESSCSVDRERVGHDQHEAARRAPLANLETVGSLNNIGVHLMAACRAWRTVPVEAVILIHALSVPDSRPRRSSCPQAHSNHPRPARHGVMRAKRESSVQNSPVVRRSLSVQFIPRG